MVRLMGHSIIQIISKIPIISIILVRDEWRLMDENPPEISAPVSLQCSSI
jgi:hypothetical protein